MLKESLLFPGVVVWSDASGSWGCGAYWGNQWCQIPWGEWPGFASASIAAKELLPIIVATAIWGPWWKGSVVMCHCDKSGSNPIPLSENQMCLFVAHLADEGLQHSSIKGYLSAVQRMQIVFGLGDPFVASWPLLECTLQGIKLGQAKRSTTRSQPRLPITPAILRLL